MSADFFSICAVLPAEASHQIFRELSSREWCGPLVGPADETVFEFSRNGTPDWAEIAAKYRGKKPSVERLQGAHVEIGVGTMEAITGDAVACEMPMSTGFASLAVVDRVLGIPRGNPILGGHAVVRVSHRHRGAFTKAWERIVEDKRAAATITPYLERYGNGRDDAGAVLAAVSSVVSRWKGDESLVFVCCPVP